MLERDRFVANEELVRTMAAITEILEYQLLGVCKSINEALSSVMSSITEIASQTEFGKKQAEEALHSTYLAPDQETQKLINSIQESVDEIVSHARKGGDTKSIDHTEEELIESQRRMFSAFSRNMKALGTLDEDLQQFLLIIIGALSNEDIISQRLEHVSRSLKALKLGLSYVIVDIDNRFTLEGIRRFKSDLLSYTIRQYTTEDERLLQEKWFKNG